MNKGVTLSGFTLVITTKIGGREVSNFYDKKVALDPIKLAVLCLDTFRLFSNNLFAHYQLEVIQYFDPIV